MKEYPLQIGCLYGDGGSVCAYYSKGHHAPEAFMAAVLEAEGETINPARVEHGERRWQCTSYSDYRQSLMPPRPGTTRRGVFPVTIIEW